jgi:hypothetical protein
MNLEKNSESRMQAPGIRNRRLIGMQVAGVREKEGLGAKATPVSILFPEQMGDCLGHRIELVFVDSIPRTSAWTIMV